MGSAGAAMEQELTRSKERRAGATGGYTMLALVAALAVIGIVAMPQVAAGSVIGDVVLIAAVAGVIFIAKGFYMLQPNHAAAIIVFGRYHGTDRVTGLRWTLPWATARKISLRANSVLSEKIKVNDLRGNPIEIAAQVVWRVTDTAQALFDVDYFRDFTQVQIEAAVRTIGSRYPYDDHDPHEVTLRAGHAQVSAALRDELIARLAVAGITVDECGFTHLAYAQEIAGAMLRRQQAQAVIAARTALVDGAVGMVELAVKQLADKNIITFDDDRRAALVSNLLVVLCSEQDTQPVISAGAMA